MLVQPLFSKIKNNVSKPDAQYFYKYKQFDHSTKYQNQKKWRRRKDFFKLPNWSLSLRNARARNHGQKLKM